MIYTNDQIRQTIIDFINETKQPELMNVVAYCIGYYGYITKQIWTEILALYMEDIIIR